MSSPFPHSIRCCLSWILCASSLVAGELDRHTPVSSSAQFDVYYSLEYAAHRDHPKPLLADVYRPRGKGPFPTILMVHGGAWFTGNKAHVALHARHAAQAGYAVVAINYRLAPQHKFPSQLEDCRDALDWIAAHADKYDFDCSRVAVYGYSAGAHLACLLGVTQNATTPAGSSKQVPRPTIRAVVAGGAPCEFSWISAESQRLAFWLGGSRAEMPEVYARASPTTHVDAQDPPTFLFHGESDRIVPISSAKQLKQKLEAQRVPTTFYAIPGANHMGAFLNASARQRALEFLNQHLASRGVDP